MRSSQNDTDATPSKKGTTQPMEENLRKAVSEMLFLFLLSKEDSYINDIMNKVAKLSSATCNVAYPYAMIYRLETYGYIVELGKKIAEDGRRRQFYRITDSGREYLSRLLEVYYSFRDGVENILEYKGEIENAP